MEEREREQQYDEDILLTLVSKSLPNSFSNSAKNATSLMIYQSKALKIYYVISPYLFGRPTFTNKLITTREEEDKGLCSHANVIELLLKLKKASIIVEEPNKCQPSANNEQ